MITAAKRTRRQSGSRLNRYWLGIDVRMCGRRPKDARFIGEAATVSRMTGTRCGIPTEAGEAPRVAGVIHSQSQAGLTPSYLGRGLSLDVGSRASETAVSHLGHITRASSAGRAESTGAIGVHRSGNDVSIAGSWEGKAWPRLFLGPRSLPSRYVLTPPFLGTLAGYFLTWPESLTSVARWWIWIIWRLVD